MKRKDLEGIDPEELLSALGIEVEGGPLSGVLPALGLFAAGLLVGTGVGLALAPRVTEMLREKLERGELEVAEVPPGSQPH